MVPVYRAGRQLLKVRAFMMLSLVGLVLCLWWGLDSMETYGLNEGDGGVLAPLPARLAMGGLIGMLGIAFAAGMWLYGRLYAARIEFDPDNKLIHLETVGFFWNNRHVINPSNLGSIRSHKDINWGVANCAMEELRDWGALAGHPIARVNAPWKTVHITGWRWPLLIDLQGVVLHGKLMKMLFGGCGN